MTACFALAALASASAEPIVDLGPYGNRVYLSDLWVDEDGAHLTWQNIEAPCPCPPDFQVGVAAATGFNVYRVMLVHGNGTPVTSPEAVKVNPTPVPRVVGPQVYNFLDDDLVPDSLTVYYVRGIYNGVEAAPSNPVGTYPPCTVAYLETDPVVYYEYHPECLIPDP